MALTLHQLVFCVLYLVIEQASEIHPLRVGINLQPNAKRELIEIGFISDDLDSFGLPVTVYTSIFRVDACRIFAGSGLGIAMVIAMGFFAAFCEPILAAITAVGTIMMPKMLEQVIQSPL